MKYSKYQDGDTIAGFSPENFRGGKNLLEERANIHVLVFKITINVHDNS